MTTKISKTATQIREEYKPQLQTLIEAIGSWNINCSELSRNWETKYGDVIQVKIINQWKHAIIKDMGVISMKSMGANIKEGMLQNMKLCNRMRTSASTDKDRLLAVKTWNECVSAFNDFLESIGEKKKVADELNITSDLLSANKFREIFETAKKKKEERNDRNLRRKAEGKA